MPEHVLPPVGVVRDYLLEHWTPEPNDTPVFIMTGAGDRFFYLGLPHYVLSPYGTLPRATARLFQLYRDLGIALVPANPDSRITVGDCTLHSWGAAP